MRKQTSQKAVRSLIIAVLISANHTVSADKISKNFDQRQKLLPKTLKYCKKQFIKSHSSLTRITPEPTTGRMLIVSCGLWKIRFLVSPRLSFNLLCTTHSIMLLSSVSKLTSNNSKTIWIVILPFLRRMLWGNVLRHCKGHQRFSVCLHVVYVMAVHLLKKNKQTNRPYRDSSIDSWVYNTCWHHALLWMFIGIDTAGTSGHVHCTSRKCQDFRR